MPFEPAEKGRWAGVIGAGSLVGDGLLPLLVMRGYRVAAFSRRPAEKPEESGIVWQMPGEPLLGDVKIRDWVCLAPISVLPGYLDWLLECGAERVVALSSTSLFTKADSSDPGERAFAENLACSERCLAEWSQAHGGSWTVLRPTLIYGFGRDKNISQIAHLIRRFRFFPLLGEARGLRQPIHLQDIAAACLASLERPAARNRAFNLSGAEILSYRDMVNRIFITLDKRPRFVRASLQLFRLAIILMRILPPFREWTPAMAERMNTDMVFDHTEAMQALDFHPRGFTPKPADLPEK